MALNRARVSNPIGITRDLQYLVPIEFFDSAAPSTVLWQEDFVIPLDATTTQLQAIVVARGQDIRRAFSMQAAAQTAVPNGTTITVP